MTQPIDIRLPFNENHYVERPLKLAEVTRWLTETQNRVLLITSPPATGKTWFMRDVQRLFDQRGDVLVFWIDVKTLLPQMVPLAENKQGIDWYKLNIWVQHFAQELQNKCDKVPDFQPEMDEGEYIEIAMRELCRQCYPDKQVIILVDQGDEVIAESWDLFERKILERFFSEKSVRFVIAFRKGQTLHSPSIKFAKEENDIVLGTFSNEDKNINLGEAQIEKLIQDLPETKTSVQALFNSIPTYKHNHSGLNTFLYRYAAQNLPLPLTPDSLKAALISINPLIAGEIDELMTLLEGISDFPDMWSADEWAARQNISSAEVSKQIQKLIDYELLTNPLTNRYILLDGLREFIWAVLKTTSTISLQTRAVNTAHVVDAIRQMTEVKAANIQIQADETSSSITLTISSEMAYRLWALFRQNSPLMQRNQIVDFHYPTFRSLMDQIEYYFNEDELRELCLCIGVPYERLDGHNVRRKIFELVNFCKRHGLLETLFTCLQETRSFVDWRP